MEWKAEGYEDMSNSQCILNHNFDFNDEEKEEGSCEVSDEERLPSESNQNVNSGIRLSRWQTT